MKPAVAIEPQAFAQQYLSQAPFQPESMKILAELVEHHHRNAGTQGHIEARSSGIKPLEVQAYTAGKAVVSVDLGGTFIKVIRGVATGNGREIKITHELRIPSKGILESTKHSVYAAAALAAKSLKLDADEKKATQGLGIGYSQDAVIDIVNETDRTGTTAIVPEGFRGTIKSESYMKDVKEGDDIGQLCFNAFKDEGFDAIIDTEVGNDTTLAAVAPAQKEGSFKIPSLPLKRSGVVAASGANTTIYVDGTYGRLSEIANAESGDRVRIGTNLLPAHLVTAFQGALINDELPIENFAGKVGLTTQFLAEIDHHLGRQSAPFITGLSQELKEKVSEGLIELLMNNRTSEIPSYLQQQGVSESPSDNEMLLLKTIAEGIGARCAQACALLVYTSAANGLDQCNYLAQLDCSMTKFFPELIAAIQQNVEAIVAESTMRMNHQGEIAVVKMLWDIDGAQSIPNQGSLHYIMSKLSANP